MNNIQPFRFERECVHGLSGISFKTVLEDHLFYDIQAGQRPPFTAIPTLLSYQTSLTGQSCSAITVGQVQAAAGYTWDYWDLNR